MDTYTIIGVIVFIALIAVLLRAIYAIGAAVRRIFYTFAAAALQTQQEEPAPRSLNGYEPTLLPLIRRDFPDFNAPAAKARVRDYLKEYFRDRNDLQIHNVVISRYLSDGPEKTIVFQAALSWKAGTILQKRFDIHYSFLLPQGRQAVAANCPNCGATLGFGEVECAYCGSRVTNALKQNWEFTQVIES